MTEAPHRYTPPIVAQETELPKTVAGYLDGTDLLRKPQALRLSTTDDDGWPRASLLSAGDVLALPPDRLRFATFSASVTTANLVSNGKVALTMVVDGGICELRLVARPLDVNAGDELTYFEAHLQSVRHHVADYATLTDGITFELHDPSSVLPCWERQLDAIEAHDERRRVAAVFSTGGSPMKPYSDLRDFLDRGRAGAPAAADHRPSGPGAGSRRRRVRADEVRHDKPGDPLQRHRRHRRCPDRDERARDPGPTTHWRSASSRERARAAVRRVRRAVPAVPR